MGTNTGIGIGIGIPFRNNALGGDNIYFPPELKARMIGVWDNYGKKNTDADRNIIKNKIPNAGGDLEILNAAYKLNSGFGEYKFDFERWALTKPPTTCKKYNDSFNITYVGRPVSEGECIVETGNNSDSDIQVYFKVEISGIEDDMEGWFNTANFRNRQQLYNGINIINVTVNSKHWYGFDFIRTDGTALGNCNIVVKQIPAFEGALVTDGINDIIASIKTLEEWNVGDKGITIISMIHQISTSKSITTTNNLRNERRVVGRNIVNNTDKTGIYGWYKEDLQGTTATLISNILGDKNDYTGHYTENTNPITNSKFYVQGYAIENGFTELSSVAHYWTFAVLGKATADEINLIIAKYNLDKTLRPDILCNITKQGITNDNHADFNDKLIDYSGNGRDIQMYNLAWKGDSGIGKYSADFESFDWAVNISQKQHNKATISLNGRLCNHTAIEVDEMKVNIIGNITELIYWYIANPDDTTRSEIRLTSGINTLPKSYAKDDGQTYNIGFAYISGDSEITIEQIPSHAGALCLDGVNDFGKVTGMPIYKGYTFIIDRKFLNETFANQVCLASKSKVAVEGENGGAFIIDNISINAIINPYSFYKTTSLPNLNTFDKQIVFQSKYKYLDKDIAAGTATDSDTLWLGTFRDNDSRFANVAIYSLMSFPYSMSEFLIERQLKKHKLGTLYPDMVEFRPIVKSNSEYQVVDCYIDTLPAIVGNYYPINSKLRIAVTTKGAADEVTSLTVNGVSLGTPSVNGNRFTFNGTLSDKSPQKINITIDEYIRFEDIVQPYPVLLRFKDENGNEVSWGGKFRVGSTITRIGSFYENNLIDGLYIVRNPKLNGNNLITPTHVVEKSMVFTCDTEYLLDNNEPKCILSPSRLRMPNSSYKILGYIPDISGHGNHGVIHNSAYIEGSGVNEDGSYQFDGVDDFVTIPTVTGGGKQVLMKVNNNTINSMLYDQRSSGASPNSLNSDFAIYNTNTVDNNLIAYQSRLVGKTYIDGILNTNITCEDLLGVLHNITITCDTVAPNNGVVPNIGRGGVLKDLYSNMALYDFMLFDNISTDDKIKELNEYVSIEAKVELPSYYWDTYGKTNLDADKATIQQRGVAEGDYDITNYNHAYDKMSGYGGYNLGRFDKSWASSSSSNTSIKVVQRNPYDITLKKLGGNSDWEFNNTELKVISNPVSVKFKSNKNIKVTCDYHYYPVGGNSEGTPLGITSKDLIANKDAIITISPISQENIDKYNIDVNRGYYLIYFQLSSTLAVNEEVTIEMLPLYPNALLYDGVTDYSENANIPALTDFTYVFKRKLLDNVAGCASMTKGLTDQQRAVVIDYINTTGGINGTSFGNMAFVPSLRDSDIIYSTTTNINGTTITKGNNPDSNGIDIGKFATYYKKMVFYKLILYPKTIPLLQINFLKNLMERDEIIDLDNPIFKK